MKHKKAESSLGRWLEEQEQQHSKRELSAPAKTKQARKKDSKPWDKKLNKHHQRYQEDGE